jgi:acyl carrier protein
MEAILIVSKYMNNKFKEILSEILELELNQISGELELNEDNWTSLSIISFIDEINQEYDIELDGEDLEEIQTVSHLEAFTFNEQK